MKIAPLGDSAAVVTLGETLDAATAAAVQALVAALEVKPLPGLIECVPANASITVYYDPARVPSTKVSRRMNACIGGLKTGPPPLDGASLRPASGDRASLLWRGIGPGSGDSR